MVKKIQIAALFPVFLCLALSGFGIAVETDQEARIQRVESCLVPGPGIIIKGSAKPQATIAERDWNLTVSLE